MFYILATDQTTGSTFIFSEMMQEMADKAKLHSTRVSFVSFFFLIGSCYPFLFSPYNFWYPKWFLKLVGFLSLIIVSRDHLNFQ